MQIKLSTSVGDIIVELDPKEAPISVENFLAYVDDQAYDGTIFHRVIDGFMIQGGGFGPGMTERRTHKPIKNEWRNNLKNKTGAIAMARLGGDPDSATSQFFINVSDNDVLDRPQTDGAAYAVFGQVVEGQDVVDAIKKVKTGSHGSHGDVPKSDVVINSVRRLTEEEGDGI